MSSRFIMYTLLAAVSMAASALAQPYPPGGSYQQPPGGNYRPAQPDQPVQPQLPTLTPRGAQPAAQQPVRLQQRPPLTPQEQAQVEQVLKAWEQRNSKVKTFDCQFRRWVYDAVFGRPDEAAHVDRGVIKYAAPDRGLLRVDTTTAKDGREVPIEDARAEHWISDGKSIIEYNHVKRQVIEHKLPPDMQGKAIADGPLPFLFGSTAEKLKERYFLRILAVRDAQGQIVPGQVCIEAYPRTLQDAANFDHAEFRINTQDMSPNALKLIQTNQKDCVVYVFFDIVLNDPLRMFAGNPFKAVRPMGWQSIVEPATDTQARRPPNGGRPMGR